MDVEHKLLQEYARTIGRQPGPWVMASIDLTAATTDATLVSVPAGRTCWVHRIDLVPAGASTLELWSGASTDTQRCVGAPGQTNALAGAQYTYGPFHTVDDGDDLVLDRGTSVAVAGSVIYCFV